MAEPEAKKATVEYINNPFFIGAKGINLVFLKTQGVAILLVILSVLAVVSSYTPPQDPTKEIKFTPEAAVAVSAVVLLVIVGSTFVNGIIGYAAAKVANDETATLKETLAAVAKRFWSFLWLQILIGLKVLAWSLLFIIPGIVMAIRYSLASVAFYDKGLKGNAAIKHSIALTKGSWITTLGGQMFFTIITFGVIDFLVGAASSAILYRQFSHIPLSERPPKHWLSVVTMILLIVTVVLVLLVAIFAVSSGLNYVDPARIEPSSL